MRVPHPQRSAGGARSRIPLVHDGAERRGFEPGPAAPDLEADEDVREVPVVQDGARAIVDSVADEEIEIRREGERRLGANVRDARPATVRADPYVPGTLNAFDADGGVRHAPDGLRRRRIVEPH